MTITDPKPGGWAGNEILTSSQMNNIRTELLKAIDGTDGGTYNLVSDLVFGGPGEVQFNGTARLNAAAALEVDDTAEIHVLGEVRVETTGAIEVDSGGEANFNTGSQMNFATGALALFDGTSSISMPDDGLISLANTSEIRLAGSAELNLLSSAAMSLVNTSAISLSDTAAINLTASGNAINVDLAEQVKVTGSTVTRFRLPMQPVTLEGLGGTIGWALQSSNFDRLLQTNVALGPTMMFPLKVNAGDVIDEITVYLNGQSTGAGHAALPATMPQIELVEVDETGAQTVFGTVVDSSANVAAYDVSHFIVSGSLGVTATEPNFYYIRYRGEAGANAVVDTNAVTALFGKVQLAALRGAYENH